MADVDVEVLALRRVLRAPDLFQQLLVSHRAPGIAHERGEQLVLDGREVHLVAVHGDHAVREVDAELARLSRDEDGVAPRGLLAVPARDADPREQLGQLAARAERIDRVQRMETSLASASEAEKSAVLAVTDQDSQTFADQARAAVQEMNAALARVVAANGSSPDAKSILLLAFGAETSALRIETLFPPHIAEENDAKMDELEASMAAQDAEVRKDLEGLAALPRLRSDPDVAAATARYAELSKLRTQILALSRENTNVRSSSISLSRKREVTLACEDALRALRQAVEGEPVDRGTPVRPR